MFEIYLKDIPKKNEAGYNKYWENWKFIVRAGNKYVRENSDTLTDEIEDFIISSKELPEHLILNQKWLRPYISRMLKEMGVPERWQFKKRKMN